MVIHLRVLAATLGTVLAMLLWTREVLGSGLLFVGFSCWLIYLGVVWTLDVAKTMNQVKKHGFMLGAFGIAMFLFSYAMVPLYHILCHGTSALPAGQGDQLGVDLFVERYRSLPIGVSLSKKHLALEPNGHDIVYVTLENQSMDNLDIKLSIASQPRTVQPYFGLVTPSVISLSPWQRTQFPVEVRFTSSIPDDLHETSLLFLFQNVDGVGQLGKQSSWEKMHSRDNYNGVRYE